MIYLGRLFIKKNFKMMTTQMFKSLVFIYVISLIIMLMSILSASDHY